MTISVQAIEGRLGGHPVRGAALRLTAATVGVVAVGLLALTIDRRLGGSALFLGLAVVVLAVSLDFDRLFAAWSNARLFRAAVDAVARGELRADHVIRSPACAGIAVLDQQSHRLFVNGRVLPVEALIRAEARSGKRRHWVEIAGDEISERIEVADRDAAERSARLIRAVTAKAA